MRDASALLPPQRAGGARGFDVAALLAPEQAVIAFLARAALRAPSVEHVALDDALGRVLAEACIAADDVPSHPRSTMDGFAVAAGATRYRIAGEVHMGRPAGTVGAGEALRIPTGGALPLGADAVVPVEDVREADGAIELRAPVAPGDSVAPRAGDLRAGEAVLPLGRRLGAPELGVLATLGVVRVPVYRKPRLGIISTGDELIEPSLSPAQGQVRDSNRYAIAASLRAMGAEAVHFPRVRDDAAAQRAAFASALEGCDGLVLTGGSSVGERDFTPRVVAELGAPGPIVHGLRVKPGKPTLLAAAGGKPVLGLPGNPTSALMILEGVARPIVAACTGERHARPIALRAIAREAFDGRPGWTWFVPARLIANGEALEAIPLPLRSSHVSLPARAGGYVVLGETQPRVDAGAPLDVVLFSAGGAPPESA